ncbi:4'-phosphopantetheinyl transferase superfamily protein [Streptomyces sp. BV286]|uniref:4'-phosphopantetheinyl transferase family protein n=1 Tax=Streptomyces sp. BV286 TaxID=2849672 RepID=UPI001C2EC50D|nr:4'-phosphopantetheinyl transferase superfamily protein [Streptomyces sp. BV286]MBV1941963.1 4'-phosphopantetheinyl transferase superfamily protein [Streptomyces sp. BV286]
MSTHAVTLRPRELRSHGAAVPPVLPGAGEAPHLWLVRTAEFRTRAREQAAAVLDRSERERAGRFRLPADRDTYLSAHLGLRLLLGAYLRTDPAEVALTRLPCPLCPEPHGRPAVEGNPVHFSLSHSDGLGLVAFAASPVGVDIERVPPPEVAEEVGRALHPRERDELRGYPPPERPGVFARTWARKEAYLKGLGTGLGRDASLDYVGTAAAPAAVPRWTISDVEVDEGRTAAAVAVRD